MQALRARDGPVHVPEAAALGVSVPSLAHRPPRAHLGEGPLYATGVGRDSLCLCLGLGFIYLIILYTHNTRTQNPSIIKTHYYQRVFDSLLHSWMNGACQLSSLHCITATVTSQIQMFHRAQCWVPIRPEFTPPRLLFNQCGRESGQCHCATTCAGAHGVVRGGGHALLPRHLLVLCRCLCAHAARALQARLRPRTLRALRAQSPADPLVRLLHAL